MLRLHQAGTPLARTQGELTPGQRLFLIAALVEQDRLTEAARKRR